MKLPDREKLALFCAAAVADLMTYVVTSVQLAVAFPAADGGVLASFLKFGGIFAVTQIPLAISEGLLTVLLWNWLKSYSPNEMSLLKRKVKGGNA